MKYFLPQRLISSFLSHAVNNFSSVDSRHHETLAFVIGKQEGEELTATEIIYPLQIGKSDRVEDEGIEHWNLFHQRQLLDDKTVIISWVHSHVRGNPCFFSSLDMHCQYAYEDQYPGILGTVFEITEENNCNKLFF